MRHIEWNRQRHFYQSAKFTILIPRHLVYKFLHTLLLDSVGIQLLILQQILQNGCRTWGMTVKQIVADNLLPMAVHIGRSSIHVQYVAFLVTHGDGNTFQASKILVQNTEKGLALIMKASP